MTKAADSRKEARQIKGKANTPHHGNRSNGL